MAEFSSSSFSINAGNATLLDFLSVPSNLLEILPADRIEDWKSECDTCSFKIKGLAHISLKLSSKSNTQVVYANTSDKPFAFRLNINANDAGNANSNLDASFDADVNSFMSMMLKKPLSAFLDSLGEAIQKKYSGA
ncbi:MAG: hypothetical protein NWR97_00550 [Salibacteraceae bacterium]|nr:hypothetical protein [Salibacteraceae bacterium]